MVAEQKINCLSEGADFWMIGPVILEKERSIRESASSITRCVTRLRTFGSDVVIAARRWGVETRTSMPVGEKTRRRMTCDETEAEIPSDRILTLKESDRTNEET